MSINVRLWLMIPSCEAESLDFIHSNLKTTCWMDYLSVNHRGDFIFNRETEFEKKEHNTNFWKNISKPFCMALAF